MSSALCCQWASAPGWKDLLGGWGNIWSFLHIQFLAILWLSSDNSRVVEVFLQSTRLTSPMVQTGSDQFQPVQNGSNYFWLVQIASVQLKPVQTSSNQFQLVPTSFDWFKPVQIFLTSSGQFQPVPTGSELVWTGWNQMELVGIGSYPFYPVATSQRWSEPVWTNWNQPHHDPQEGDGENFPGNRFQTYKGQDDFEAPTLICVGESHWVIHSVGGWGETSLCSVLPLASLFVHVHHRQMDKIQTG